MNKILPVIQMALIMLIKLLLEK